MVQWFRDRNPNDIAHTKEGGAIKIHKIKCKTKTTCTNYINVLLCAIYNILIGQ